MKLQRSVLQNQNLLLPQNQLQSQNQNQQVDLDAMKGVLGTLDSVFKRFRGQFIGNIAKDLEYCQQVIGPLLRVAGLLTAQVVAGNGQDAVAVEGATLLLSVFYSLNSPGLTDEFEDHLDAWMDCIHKLVTLPNPAVAAPQQDEDEEAPVDACKAMACECLSLFMERNEEEFAKFLETFVESVWKQLVEVGQGVGQDRLAMAAIAFLTTVAKSVHYTLFQGEEILKQVCQGVIIPNIRLREGDIELFEMNWVEYVRRDAEGSDSETRRRAASELVKALVDKFPGETTQLFSGYVGSLLTEAGGDPAGKWQAKDAAVYLVTALAAKTKTSSAGATTTNELVNLAEFYTNHVAPELKAKFEAQQQKLNDAIASDDGELIAKRASAMSMACRALDAAARADGIKPADEALWIGKRRDGELVCIYTSAVSFGALPDHMPRFSIDELVNMIPTAALKAKAEWPDATIEGISARELDDEIPF